MEKWEALIFQQNWLTPKERKFVRDFCITAKNSPERPGHHRLRKYITTVKMCHTATGKSLSAMLKNIKAFEKAKNAIWDFKGKTERERKGYSFDSKKDMIKILGRFYNFKHNEDISLKYAPPELKRVCEVKRKGSEDPKKEPAITREDIRELVRTCDNMFDRALIFTLFETGARPSEFAILKKSDIQQTDKGIIVHIPKTKNKERYVPIVESKRFLNEFLTHHPSKGDDAPLWTSPFTGKPIGERSIAMRIHKIVKRWERKTGKSFGKPYYPDHFRKSRVTEFIEMGGTAQMSVEYFAHSVNTAMKYYNLGISLKKMENSILAMHAEAPPEVTQVITNWKCHRCAEKNSMASRYCGKCGASQNTTKEAVENLDMKKKLEKQEQELKRHKSLIEKIMLVGLKK